MLEESGEVLMEFAPACLGGAAEISHKETKNLESAEHFLQANNAGGYHSQWCISYRAWHWTQGSWF
jgi:hypothetical protein